MATKSAASSFASLCAACAALPGVTQDVKWGEDLVFSVGSKMFAVTRTDGSNIFSFKVDDDRFLELTDRPGIIPAPYLARAKWVQITDSKALSNAEAIALLERSYQLVFAKLTKKLQQEIGHE
ncbi:MAG TPA: MmcQ/YjbR family DNA-binding protein [Burkholderiaceae bacterium]|jgi:predicted DNA-binding protein (MmcQ/YjbR family)|nr:MmcQ/YjbR family DNA-binding protein [Burkholderiaceae bacterium]